MLQSGPSEPCSPVHSDLADAQAVHTSVSPLHCDAAQAEPRALQTHPTPQPTARIRLPFTPVPPRRQAPLTAYRDQMTFMTN